MRVDSRLVAVLATGLAVALALGAVAGTSAGVWSGVLAALAGLIPATVLGVGLERRAQNAARLKRRNEVIETFAPRRITEPAAERGVAWYLRPEAQVVSFRFRPELAELHDWCVNSGHFKVRLVTGNGGAGKTRLAMELATNLTDVGWQAMWISRGLERGAIGAARDIGRPAILIVDYAETRPSLSEFLVQAAEALDAPDMRVVLLARSAGEWWQQLLDSADYQLGQIQPGRLPHSREWRSSLEL